MEMQSQDLNMNDSAAVLENRPAHKVKSNRNGWGQLSSQNSRPLTLCYAKRRVLSEGKKKRGHLRVCEVTGKRRNAASSAVALKLSRRNALVGLATAPLVPTSAHARNQLD